MRVMICENTDCMYYKPGEGECTADYIRVGDYDYGCNEYYPYTDLEEYQSEFYKHIVKGGKHYKEKCRGKRIEYKDLVLFTETHPLWIRHCTEERTGICVGSLADLEGRYERAIELLKNAPDVKDLPDKPED